MKKILILLVAILLCFTALTSCGDNNDGLKDYISAQSATNPTGADISVSVETALGVLNGTLAVTYNEDGSSVISYSYEKFNAIGEGEGDKSTVTGEITCDKDGKYSGAVSGSVGTAAALKLNLDESLMSDVRFDDGVCSSVIKAENTLSVLGVELSADAKLVLYKNDGKISSFTLVYRDGQGAVSIACEYK